MNSHISPSSPGLAAILSRFLFAFLLTGTGGMLPAQRVEKIPAVAPAAATVQWQSLSAQHAYGFPEVKPNKKGTLTLDEAGLTFTGKTFNTTLPRESITAVNAGNDRVELWGTGGRLLRMAIPQGGGLAAAAVMHHRVDMLTVEFRDTHGGAHSAVFYLPATEADKALTHFTVTPVTDTTTAVRGCDQNPVDPHSVLVKMPEWKSSEVPAAYRALVYEHIIDRMKAVKDVGSVYREGELVHGMACPHYTVAVAIEGYKKGNQVVRAATGPLGMFMSPTQMRFAVSYSDAMSGSVKTEEVKATVRSESESTTVADMAAKKLAKQYDHLLKEQAKVATASASPHVQ
ncbi:hypothetical protein [Terriglobus roseus]|uniref:Uncharacterized protein n=1 Tax=Terriglobus roseus TaxID=392734 RepID=A0A1G7G2X7_9BACT|nr:hypothetical protein [Terriglobus roseus]SDE82491.1 hypothetical protein SAMN05444167_0539 [Terriglobus roseus]